MARETSPSAGGVKKPLVTTGTGAVRTPGTTSDETPSFVTDNKPPILTIIIIGAAAASVIFTVVSLIKRFRR